jgi:ATP-dependent Clp protease ATP-binding subunit ClpA
VHSTVGAGATTGGTMDLATLIKPVLTAGELRVVGSTTFEEFKQIEKDRGLARGCRRSPSTSRRSTRPCGFPKACGHATSSTTTCSTRTARSRRQARRRGTTRSRLPDSAIDILDGGRHAAPAAGGAGAAAGRGVHASKSGVADAKAPARSKGRRAPST